MKNKKKLIKPVGKVNIFASYGLISWAVNEEGRKFMKWGEEGWIPTKVEYEKEKKEENEEKKK